MGHKVNPKLFRIGPVYNWDSRWFDEDNYKETLLEDFKLRKIIGERLKNAGVSDVVARDIIGHESVAVSASYTHIDMDTKRSALGKLPEIK